MKRARHRAALRAGLAAGLALIAAAGPRAGTPRAPSSAATSRPGATGSSAPKPAVRLDPRERAARDAHGNLLLEVRVEAQDTYPSLARQYLADPDRYRDLRHGNGRHVPAAGGTIRIPYAILSDARKLQAIDDLFPRDRTRDGDWVHRAGEGRLPASEERLRDLALWLTGDDDNSDALAEKNGLSGAALARGQEIVIPGDLLLPPFAARAGGGEGATASAATAPGPPGSPGMGQAPPGAGTPEPSAQEDDFTEAPGEEEGEAEAPAPAPPGPIPLAEGAEDLTYGTDGLGRHAIYRLKQGEALYSAVVVRYTGRVDAQDVNDLAQQIAKRSGITNVKDIPIGYRVKIPLDDLLPEYLPRDDPRRQAWESSRAEVARYTNRASSRNLQGVAVILDAGHGGRDSGAAHNGIWEHDYVYDILCRVKALLETRTRARVLPTIKDRKEGYTIHDSTRLPRSRAEILLTDPPFSLQGRPSSVNLRWYLANSYYRKLTGEGFDPQKIVFTSLHADARHPSLRGAMVYVPGEAYRRGRYGHSEAIYTRYREVREEPYVTFPQADRKRSEGLSRQFAASLVASFRERGVALPPFAPVRERIIRRGRSWVPAVLRCNQVPVEVLIEISNLSNPSDSRSLADPAYRQKVAEAYVDALSAYYGGPLLPAQGPVAGGR